MVAAKSAKCTKYHIRLRFSRQSHLASFHAFRVSTTYGEFQRCLFRRKAGFVSCVSRSSRSEAGFVRRDPRTSEHYFWVRSANFLCVALGSTFYWCPFSARLRTPNPPGQPVIFDYRNSRYLLRDGRSRNPGKASSPRKSPPAIDSYRQTGSRSIVDQSGGRGAPRHKPTGHLSMRGECDVLGTATSFGAVGRAEMV